jgi:dienelactone hydrolase
MRWTREDVRYPSGQVECAAWLYRPTEVERPPVVVLCHGLGGTRERRLDAYAERFAAAGMAALPFTYRNFGDSGGEPRQLLDIDSQLDDIAAAATYVRGRKDLDGSRVALWGSSFGGGHVMVAAARDGAVRAVVSQCPFTDGRASGGTLGLVSTLKVGTLAIADHMATALGRGPVYARLSGTRGDAALMNAPDVVAGYRRLIAGASFNNDVAARIALQVLGYRPGRSLAQLHCLILLCVCDHDTVAPAEATLKYAQTAANAVIKRYPIGHFDIYFDAPFERAVADQLTFLQQHLALEGRFAPRPDAFSQAPEPVWGGPR